MNNILVDIKFLFLLLPLQLDNMEEFQKQYKRIKNRYDFLVSNTKNSEYHNGISCTDSSDSITFSNQSINHDINIIKQVSLSIIWLLFCTRIWPK